MLTNFHESFAHAVSLDHSAFFRAAEILSTRCRSTRLRRLGFECIRVHSWA